jgi:4-diphosphocytidyl-2-C-methyl-D-erythritol kinase
MNRVARAKINLSLRILGKRADGFHEIDTLIAPIALADELAFREAPAFAFSCSDASLPTDDSNLVVRAARLFAERTGCPANVHIHLEKKIPHGAGLGGGSSDAAAVLCALNDRANSALSLADLSSLAAELGSDVPFFLHHSAARCRGRGEVVEPCALDANYRLLLIKPPFPVPTPWAYQHWLDSTELPDVEYAPQRLAWGDLVNGLERPVFEKYLLLPALKSWLLQQPEVAGALMSGSGSTSFATVHGSASIDELERRARAQFGDELWYCQTEIVA